MSEQANTTAVVDEAPESSGAFVMSEPFSNPWEAPEEPGSSDDSDEAGESAESDDSEEEDSGNEESGDDAASETVRIGDEDVSRETLSRVWTEFNEAKSDELLAPFLAEGSDVSLLQVARFGAELSQHFQAQTENPDASYGLIGDVMARHFIAHGELDEEEADERAMDIVYGIKNPATLDPEARPYYHAAMQAARIAAKQYEIAQDLALQVQEANNKLADSEQGPELLQKLLKKIPDAEISGTDLRAWMKKIGTDIPEVAYAAYAAELQAKGAKPTAKGAAKADAKKAPNQPKQQGQNTFDPKGMTAGEIGKMLLQGRVPVNN
jgi:hypothetical protein